MELCDKLKMLLSSMHHLVTDAELKQIHNPSVRSWLDYARECVLDAEDLFDDIHIQVTQSNLESESQTTNRWVQKIFSPFNLFDNKVERMNKLVGKLESLQSKKDLLNLKNARGISGALVLGKVESCHDQPDERYGRVDDKETIINWVISSSENGDKLSIISIVGMGGLGKTTLAQYVYNDPRVESEFDILAWVCISDDFEVLKVTKKILGAINGTGSADGATLQQLHRRFKEKLLGKKFFLVMDDVWNNKCDKWEAVQIPLMYGAAGSTILVTTRSVGVANCCMRSNKTHALQKLEEEHCWRIFLKHAFNDENHQLEPEFEKIGRQIVKKCQGLPLAVKAIGNLLHRRSHESYWTNILKSEIWQLRGSEVLPSLLLSYHHLPSHLKVCFAFCALFPKNFLFERENLILLWMAENFLQCSQHNNKSMEEIGNEYFDDLVSRSFFQQSNQCNKYYVMHDLLNDLAKYVCGDAYFRLDIEKEQSILRRTRHFSFERCDIRNFEGLKDLREASRLRTFLSTSNRYYERLDFSHPNDWKHDLFSKFKFIRVLSLCGNYDLVEVPDSVGNLKHLRSLDLSCTRIKMLPDSTCSLFNLQILKLRECRFLKELPLNLHKLTKLCHLDLRGTELREFPVHLGKLKNLQILMGSFLVDKGRNFSIKQFRELSLYGELRISDTQNIVNPSDALAANLKSKMRLRKLELEWSENHYDSMKEKEVLEKLQPSKRLEQLGIKNYGGTGFPHWFGDDSLSNLVSLKLSKCEYCLSLPSLGVLPSLKKLSIIGFRCIDRIGEEFYGSTSPSFKSLEALSFKDMEEWEKWNCKAGTGAFPCLRKLSIKKCPKLKEQLPTELPCLKKLKIHLCEELVASLSPAPDIQQLGSMLIDDNPYSLTNMEVSTLEVIGFPAYISLEVLNIGGFSDLNILSLLCFNSLQVLSISFSCDSLTTFPLHLFPNLHSLDLVGCCNLQMISQEESHNHLRHLSIRDCPQFESFNGEGLSAPGLKTFTLNELENLRSLPKQMHTLLPSLLELWIGNCPQVELISDEGLPSNLTSLRLSNCSKLMASLKVVLGANISLRSLMISGMGVESFPDEGTLPLSLTSLVIADFPDLKILNYKGLCHLFSLDELWLITCPNIQCLPEEGLPKSISSIMIYNCPFLTHCSHCCRKPNGQDWEKIVHVQTTTVLNKFIRE